MYLWVKFTYFIAFLIDDIRIPGIGLELACSGGS